MFLRITRPISRGFSTLSKEHKYDAEIYHLRQLLVKSYAAWYHKAGFPSELEQLKEECEVELKIFREQREEDLALCIVRRQDRLHHLMKRKNKILKLGGACGQDTLDSIDYVKEELDISTNVDTASFRFLDGDWNFGL